MSLFDQIVSNHFDTPAVNALTDVIISQEQRSYGLHTAPTIAACDEIRRDAEDYANALRNAPLEKLEAMLEAETAKDTDMQ